MSKLIKRLSPICYGHHIWLSFGYAILPFTLFKWSIGYFEFGKSNNENEFCNPKWGIRVFKINEFHNCTWTGRY